jgi:hypothetical protein
MTRLPRSICSTISPAESSAWRSAASDISAKRSRSILSVVANTPLKSPLRSNTGVRCTRSHGPGSPSGAQPSWYSTVCGSRTRPSRISRSRGMMSGLAARRGISSGRRPSTSSALSPISAASASFQAW